MGFYPGPRHPPAQNFDLLGFLGGMGEPSTDFKHWGHVGGWGDPEQTSSTGDMWANGHVGPYFGPYFPFAGMGDADAPPMLRN